MDRSWKGTHGNPGRENKPKESLTPEVNVFAGKKSCAEIYPHLFTQGRTIQPSKNKQKKKNPH